jgi:hypothetical protein
MKHRISTLLLLFISSHLFCQRPTFTGDFNHNFDSENLQFATVKIVVYKYNKKDPTKTDTASGTSFIFSFNIDSTKQLPILVTNKHVINDAFSYSIYLTRKNEAGKPAFGKIDTLNISSLAINWIPHPDPNIDLCATPFVPILNKFSKSKFGYSFYSITDYDIPPESEVADFKGIEDIYMIGYPIGLWDFKNNLPIIRKGITATHPFFNYQNAPIFLIDAACFPGSSGSPVFIINEGTYSTKTSSRMGRRKIFLGILFGGPTFQPDGSIKIIDIPTEKDPIYIQTIPINLGYCIKSNQVLLFKKAFGL